MHREIAAWPGDVGPMTGHWSANQYHDDRAQIYVRGTAKRADEIMDALEGIVHFSDAFGAHSDQGPLGKALRDWLETARKLIETKETNV